MFEHMRNWAALLQRLAGWLTTDGKAFVHVFSHGTLAYRFEGTWAAERFFTAGTMPSHDLADPVRRRPGRDEALGRAGNALRRELKAWLTRLDAHAHAALRILRAETPTEDARALLATWRLFLISTAEIWALARRERVDGLELLARGAVVAEGRSRSCAPCTRGSRGGSFIRCSRWPLPETRISSVDITIGPMMAHHAPLVESAIT